MADKTFNTRISLKYDTYANWINKDPVLLAGEAAVVVVPAKSSAVQQEPAVLFKIGDGAKKFSELSFVSGLAANVYSWALAETKPSYSATEISGHKTDATAMNSAIIALEGIVDGIGGDGEKATVVAYVTDAIAALKIGDYAKAADLTALAGRVDTLEGTAHEHANKAVLDGITAEKITAWDGKADANHKHDIADLNQAAGYIVLNCGSASVNI